MKSCDELKTEMEAIYKRNGSANALEEVKCPCKEFGFTASMLNGALAERRGKK